MSITSTAYESVSPFRRPVAVERLSRDAETPFRVAAEPGELLALARYLDVGRIDRLSLAGFISPTTDGGWRMRGRLVAKLEQRCVVTLRPVRSRHDAEIERLYLPAHRIPRMQGVLVSHDDEDEPDPFTDCIDPAQFAVESLALMIDPYRRAEGAELTRRDFTAPEVTPLGDESSRPFGSLTTLKVRGGDDND